MLPAAQPGQARNAFELGSEPAAVQTYSRSSLGVLPRGLSATLENEADATLENEATGSCCLVCRVLGSDARQSVDAAVA